MVYTGIGFAEIHYNCAKCIGNDFSLSRVFFPTKLVSHEQGQCDCGCATDKVSSCGGGCSCSMPVPVTDSKGNSNCNLIKINKLDITNDFSSVHVPQAPSFLVLFCEYIPTSFIEEVEEHTIEYVVDILPPLISRFYLNLYCTLLI